MILMNDFRAEPADLRSSMLSAIERVIDSGWYILGKECANFEKLWAEACGAAAAVGVANGMDAIEIALRGLGVGPGDEVITTPMTAFATVLAITRTGAIPVLADILEESALLSLESAKRCLTKKTKAIVLVHLYGQVRDIETWQSFCAEHSLFLVEDCAQAHLATYKEKGAGTFGVAGAYSFYPTKNLGACGDAGMLVTNNMQLVDIARKLRNYGQDERYYHSELGLNSRLDEIQAALLTERLKWLREFTNRRREVATAYRNGVDNANVVHLIAPEEENAHVHHLHVITCRDRKALQTHLHELGIQSFCHYPVPIHHQKPCKDIRRDVKGLAVSELHAEICLSLPCHPQMTDADIAAVISALNLYKRSK